MLGTAFAMRFKNSYMKKMEKTAGEKPGKEAAIRKDNEDAAEKIDIKTDAVNGGLKKDNHDRQPDQKPETEKNKEIKSASENVNENKIKNKPEPNDSKGSGLKSSVEGENRDNPLATDDDGTIVL